MTEQMVSRIPIFVSAAIGREGAVDGQGDMYAPGVLRAVVAQLPRTAVTYCFNVAGGPIGVVDRAWMVERDLWATVLIHADRAQVIEGKTVTVRPWFRVVGMHQEGNVRVIDRLEMIGVSVVPEATAVCIDEGKPK